MIDTFMRKLTRLFPQPIAMRVQFIWHYYRQKTPWDTEQTPPEVVEFVVQAAPGRALDLGCGTGTNVIYLAEHGWEAVGVDYVPQAIQKAKAKIEQKVLNVQFYQADVTNLERLPLTAPFDFLLDIGCLHSIPAQSQSRYATHAARLTKAGACYMLYAGLPHRLESGHMIGLAPEDVAALFAPHFDVERQEIGEDTGGGTRMVLVAS